MHQGFPGSLILQQLPCPGCGAGTRARAALSEPLSTAACQMFLFSLVMTSIPLWLWFAARKPSERHFWGEESQGERFSARFTCLGNGLSYLEKDLGVSAMAWRQTARNPLAPFVLLNANSERSRCQPQLENTSAICRRITEIHQRLRVTQCSALLPGRLRREGEPSAVALLR